MDILEKIAVNKRIEIEELKINMPLSELKKSIPAQKDYLFKKALSHKNKINIIAELKKGSPSKGIIKEDFDPAVLARKYFEGKAVAISVLTEKKYFFGQYEYLKVVKDETGLPVLCKDFIIDAYQIYHAKFSHADAVLLIVKLLSKQTLNDFIELARQVGLDVLVEVHNSDELEIALNCGAEIIGVNNRNLNDFTVDLKTAEKLGASIPDSVIKVAESGIFTYDDIKSLQSFGYNNFLIGEALVKADDPVKLLNSLQGR